MPTPAAQELAAQLKGQTLRIPNLKNSLARWPTVVSPHYDELKRTVESKIAEWIPDEPSRTKAKRVDLAFFSASWYPYCSLDRLETMCWYSLWIFLWDDFIENLTVPVSTVQQPALKYFEYHLGLAPAGAHEPPAPNQCCTLFQHCAKPLKEVQTVAERRRFLDQIAEYMKGCKAEQTFNKGGDLPNVAQYWDERLETSSVWSYCAIADYMVGVHLPDGWYETGGDLKALWLEANRHIVTMNDLVSFKKELDKFHLQSLIPIVMKDESKDLDGAVDVLVKNLNTIGDNLERAIDTLMAKCGDDSALKAAVDKYVMGFRTNLTGNYVWSLECDRYGVKKYLQADGTLVIPL